MAMVVLAVAALLVAPAIPAAANVSGCTGARGGGLVCGYVGGAGLYVQDAQVSHSIPDWQPAPTVCDYEGVVTVYDSNSTKIYQQHSGRVPGCALVSGYVDFYINRYFPNNSKITLSFYEDFGQYKGAVSFKITR
jgi:hypothetical protein